MKATDNIQPYGTLTDMQVISTHLPSFIMTYEDNGQKEHKRLFQILHETDMSAMVETCIMEYKPYDLCEINNRWYAVGPSVYLHYPGHVEMFAVNGDDIQKKLHTFQQAVSDMRMSDGSYVMRELTLNY